MDIPNGIWSVGGGGNLVTGVSLSLSFTGIGRDRVHIRMCIHTRSMYIRTHACTCVTDGFLSLPTDVN